MKVITTRTKLNCNTTPPTLRQHDHHHQHHPGFYLPNDVNNVLSSFTREVTGYLNPNLDTPYDEGPVRTGLDHPSRRGAKGDVE